MFRAIRTLIAAAALAALVGFAPANATDGVAAETPAVYGNNAHGFTVYHAGDDKPFLYPPRKVALARCDGDIVCKESTKALYRWLVATRNQSLG